MASVDDFAGRRVAVEEHGVLANGWFIVEVEDMVKWIKFSCMTFGQHDAVAIIRRYAGTYRAIVRSVG